MSTRFRPGSSTDTNYDLAKPMEDHLPGMATNNDAVRNIFGPIENFTKYFRIQFTETTREISGYAINDDIKQLSGGKVDRIEAEGKNVIVVKTSKREQSEKIKGITKLCGKDVTVTAHDKLNYTQGLIYINNFDVNESDLSELEGYIREKCPSFHSLDQPTYVKSRNPNTQAYLLKFSNDYLPDFLDIGEVIAVRRWVDRPLRCKKCLQYGHSAGSDWSRCGREERCKYCTDQDHKSADCKSDNLKCLYCQENHETGNKKCIREIKEQKIVDIQSRQKVGFMRAKQIYEDSQAIPIAGTTSLTGNTFNTHYNIEVDRTVKRKIAPWAIENP